MHKVVLDKAALAARWPIGLMSSSMARSPHLSKIRKGVEAWAAGTAGDDPLATDAVQFKRSRAAR